ncbi:UvrD-helicase domain-containing protein [Agrobacterium rubi]|uniref:DNA 3'-5' helicase n=1 Tax=Agrobacterium rubi TR3 = NBRC 13261 TaxID=1368415 RepID=A0A081CRG8_9HYPH|nr:UvrD-helicase domain-containing protein [Agrobacterium rubi]MBP1876929.1 DNA helicase-2/ATP-dependent DNA helicase PcrA [Agrobacterium rubi]MCL6651117.1 ATP-dependent DNA helicase [Agrobacterium rubi]NTF07871.1 UvrD-helicase domain-containing protein [Agrobacterium rubi]NTF20115.1 UvrD-helicase domain-containing protein [Agrobacterium rubi]NTF27086.1 UvrD-helicase domain-containing protein [Agrobacterium rubi]
MSNSFDDMPFFDEEPSEPRRQAAVPPAAGGLGIAAQAMAARDQGRAAPDYLAGLNPEQREAVETLEGPVLVLAGAGTGKTRVLTTRIAHILATGRVYPSQILAVTFTNKAAREMKERIGVLVGGAVEGMPWLGTFHSIGVKLLRRHAELMGLKSDFTILDTDDVVRLLKQLIQAEGLDDKRWPAKQFAGMIDGWKNKGLTPPEIPEGDSRAFANGKGRELYAAYQARLKTLNACDFGDLLLHPITIFRNHPDILKEYHQKFRYILVDEYQDTNTCQYMWLRLLAQRPKGQPQNVCCVGDDDQSIYGWRGAEVDNILRFDKDFVGAKVIKLERNYRSTEHILGAAGHLIAHNEGRLGKTLFTDRSEPDDEKVVVHAAWDSEEEARAVGEEIEQLQRTKHPLNNMAILVRASFQMREFEDRFVTLGLNYRVIGGPRFYERLEIRDALAYFRLVCQSADDLAFERIINTPKRGLGDTTVRNLHDYARARDIPMLAAAADIIETDELKPKARKALFDVVQDFRRWQNLLENTEHTVLAEQILDESGYTAMWQADKTAEGPGRLENLKELIRSMEAYESMRSFLEHVALVMDTEKNAELDAVSIMTLHSAKGLEFETVFLPGWEEGLFPHQRSLDEGGRSGLEEERRLAYVGITRAKRRCHIWFVSNRRIHGLWQATIPSRFLEELPPNHVEVSASESSYGGYGGRGGYGQSRFDAADPFTNNYSTPGWKRAQANKSDATRDNWGSRSGHSVDRIGYGESGPKSRTIDGELVAKSVADTPSKFFIGDRVFHMKFGNGNVAAIEGNKLTIDFDRAGQKRVLDGFVERAEKSG